MRDDILNKITADLLSVPPLIFRGVRRKLLKMALDNTKVDISPPHFEIMKLLDETGTLHVAEIGEKLLIARAQMTHLIDKLVDLGIVERQMDTADRRMISHRFAARPASQRERDCRPDPRAHAVPWAEGLSQLPEHLRTKKSPRPGSDIRRAWENVG